MENKIRALRSEMGLSQEELARRCGVSPVSYTHLTLPTICSV